MLAPYPSVRRATTRAAALAIAGVLLAVSCSGSGSDTASDRSTSAERPAPEGPTSSTTTSSTTVPTPTTAPSNGFPAGWTPDELNWTKCDVASGAQCATLAVPLDWSVPTGPTVDLALARVRATGERIGAVIANPGGPGASGLDFLGYGPFSDAITERFDTVSWDPRGVGGSDPVTCGVDTATDMLQLDPDPDDASEQQALDRAARAVSSDCAGSDLSLLQHIGTVDVARDLEAIRLALGDDPLNYVGYSYGTQIGQQYAQMFPDDIRTMVLDGVVDPSLGFTEFLLGQTAAFDAVFEVNADRCASAGEDKCGVENLGDAYDRVHTMVEKEPLGSGSSVVGPAELAIGAVLTTYADDGWKRLGPALAEALDGKGKKLRTLADAYYDFGGYAAYAGVECIDSPPPSGVAEYEQFADTARRLSPRFGGSVANEMLPCATWPVEPVGEPAAVTAPGAPPILVVGNRRDAATPYENAVAVAKALESGVLVTADIGGHTAYGADECVTQVVDDYLIDLDVPDEDPRCP